jgi:uncharacterized protein
MMIGRIEERQKLLKANASEYSQFITVYGRRRVGKTFFVRETFDYTFTFQHSGLAKTPLKGQLKAWQSSLKYSGFKAKCPKTWLEAFDQLKDLILLSTDKRKVVFIDEMPWMDTPRSGFIPALEHFWNGWASARKDITLIVCGSATSWIINKLIRNKAGLRGRVTTKIRIQPFTLAECEAFAKNASLGMTRSQIAECAMIMGGIPYYWTFLDREYSLAQNIDNLFFSADGDLVNEYDELYTSLFKSPEPYMKIVTALGKRKMGLSREEIISEGFDDNGKLSTMLDDLEQCGFIRKYSTFGYKSNNAIYQLIDSYTLFYFKFIKENGSGDERFWSHNQGTPLYYNWCGLAFERLCFLHTNQIKQALGITGVVSNICAWRSFPDDEHPGCQIDMLIDRNDNVIDICEMKFTKEPFRLSSEAYEEIRRRQTRFIEITGTAKAVHLVLISANGTDRNGYLSEFQKILDLDTLFLPYLQI